jgi:hypothetical protein
LPQGTYNVTVQATDAAGNVGTDATTNELTRVDGDPEVLFIQALTSPLVTNVDEVVYEVTFNLPMVNITVDDFELQTGISGASITSITEVTSTVFDIAINTGTTEGTIALEVLPNETMLDILGRPLPIGAVSTEVYEIKQFRFTQNLNGLIPIAAGSDLNLNVATTGYIGDPNYTWYRKLDGTKIVGFDPIPGEFLSSLIISPFTVGDLGQYYVTAEDTTTGVLIESNTTQLIEAAGVPVAGMGGMALLTALSALAGAAAIRRRKK